MNQRVALLPLLPLLTLSSLFPVTAITQADDDPNWVRIALDDRFRSEGVAAGDFNKDGVMDVVAGDVWYQAPSTGNYTDP